MTHPPSPPVAERDLVRAARELAALLKPHHVAQTARIQELEEAIREAETYLHRRAARNARDQACYRIGSALEPHNNHTLCDVAFAGFDHLGSYGLLLLLPIALAHPSESFGGLLRLLFASEGGAAIRQWGAWSRLTWLRGLYVKETVTFLETKKAQDPKERWRTEAVTARQKHLLREISRALGINEPKFRKRGDAFEWIKAQGGNPRFWTPPPTPPLPSLPQELV